MLTQETITKIVSQIPPDFYDLVETPGLLKKVLYSDTDSIFITIPVKDIHKLSKEEKWDIVIKNGKALNTIIQTYLYDIFFKRANCNPDYNKTNFKSEFQYEMMMFMPVKKQYAYKIMCKEGKFFNPPKVKYTGIQIVRSDAATWTQDLLRDMIENVIFNNEIAKNDKLKEITNVVTKYRNKLLECVENFDFVYIGKPGKWSKDKLIINGMKLFNQLMEQELFTFGSAGKFVYCKVPKNNKEEYNGITVPYEFDKEKLKEKFIKYRIKVDVNRMWDMLFTTTCQHVVNIVKNS